MTTNGDRLPRPDEDMTHISPDIHRQTREQRRGHNGGLKWRVAMKDPVTKKSVEQTVEGLDEALRVRAAMRAAVSKPAWQRPPDPSASADMLTLNEWVPEFLRLYANKKDGPRPATSMANAAQRLTTYILPALGQRVMSQVTLPEIEDMVAGLTKKNGEPLALSSKESVAGTIKTVWTMASRRGKIHGPNVDNVVNGLSAAWGGEAASARRLVRPSLTKVDLLAEAMGDLGPVVNLLAYTGLRWEEASGLWVSDVNFKTRFISCQRVAPVVRGKRVPPSMTMKSRHALRDVLIVEQAVEPLQQLMRRAKSVSAGAEPVLVTGERGRGPLHYRTWRNALAKAQAETGVTYTAHELRHVYASILIDAKFEDVLVAKYMGHSSAAYTRRLYGHWFEEDGNAQAAHLSAAIEAIKAREAAIARLNEDEDKGDDQ